MRQRLQAQQVGEGCRLRLVARRHVQVLCCARVQAQARVAGSQRARSLAARLWAAELEGGLEQVPGGGAVAGLVRVRGARPQRGHHLRLHIGGAVQSRRHVVTTQRLQRQALAQRGALLGRWQGRWPGWFWSS